jgi:hypothetical protein
MSQVLFLFLYLLNSCYDYVKDNCLHLNSFQLLRKALLITIEGFWTKYKI